MFTGCSTLKEINLNIFNTNSAIDIRYNIYKMQFEKQGLILLSILLKMLIIYKRLELKII